MNEFFEEHINPHLREIEKLSKMTNAEFAEYIRQKKETVLTPHYLWSESRGVVKEWTTN